MQVNKWIDDIRMGLMEGEEYSFLVKSEGMEERRTFRLEKKRQDYCDFSYKPVRQNYRVHIGLRYDVVRGLLNGATL